MLVGTAVSPVAPRLVSGGLEPPFELLHLWLFGNLPDGSVDSTFGEQTVTNFGTASTQSRVLGDTTAPETTDPAAVVFDGVRCIEFSGAQYAARLNATSIVQPFTLWVLFRLKQLGITQTIWGGVTTGNYLRVSNTNVVALRAGTLISTANTVGTAQWHMAVGVGNGASSRVRLDLGTSVVGDAGTGNWGASDKLGSLATPGNYLQGYIAAVAVVSGAATEAQDQQMWNYLRAVKGIV